MGLWTVTGTDHLPVAPAEEFLCYCSTVGPVETYALALLLRHLDERGLDWRELSLKSLAEAAEFAP